MRVIRYGFGNITQNGEPLHTGVLYQVDDTKRVAVWVTRVGGPDHVYAPDTVEYTLTRKPCSCKGDPSRMGLVQQWMKQDKALADA